MLQRNSVLAATLALFALIQAPAYGDDDAGLKPVTDPKVNSPKEELRLKLFQADPKTPACATVSADPRGSVKAVDQGLDDSLRAIIKAIKAKSDKDLQPWFHKRLNVKLAAISETYGKMELAYGAPFDVSVFRLWAVNTVDGRTGGIPCADDGLSLFPHYGYPLQFAAWLQVMGQKELGRVFVSLVPTQGRWVIGAFHVQQWTHASKDYSTWAQDAQKTAQLGHKTAAFVKYDLAVKLLDGGGFIEIKVRGDVIKVRDQVMSQDEWGKAIRDALTGFDVVHTSTLLVVDGAGILVRLKVPEEISVENMKKACRDMGGALLKHSWASHLEGIRCSYVLPKEDPKVEGMTGSIYMSFADIQKASKK